jgi:hypothetical protein
VALTTEQREIQLLAREFAEGELRPHGAHWDETCELGEEVFAKLSEVGFLGMRVPEALGGLELDWPTYLVVLEELSRGDPAVALSVAIHNGPVTELLLRHGSQAQQERWLPRMASGEVLGAFALSEVHAGSDAGAVEAEARPRGDGWVLSGRKHWVTNGRRAGLVAVFARTGASSPALGCFLVDTASDGYTVGERVRTMGLRASETLEVSLEEVALPADALLGERDQGFRYAMEALAVGRAGIAAQAVGIAQAALEHAASYALEREQFGRPIAEFGAIRDKLGEMAARIAGARALVREVAEGLEARGSGTAVEADGRAVSARAAMAKLLATRTAMWVTDESVQVFGGYGYMRDYPVEKLMRDAKGTEIYEGTSEILRWIIAREVLRAARPG